jgi:hypothetical protein
MGRTAPAESSDESAMTAMLVSLLAIARVAVRVNWNFKGLLLCCVCLLRLGNHGIEGGFGLTVAIE